MDLVKYEESNGIKKEEFVQGDLQYMSGIFV